jgi:hypothetical protein
MLHAWFGGIWKNLFHRNSSKKNQIGAHQILVVIKRQAVQNFRVCLPAKVCCCWYFSPGKQFHWLFIPHNRFGLKPEQFDLTFIVTLRGKPWLLKFNTLATVARSIHWRVPVSKSHYIQKSLIMYVIGYNKHDYSTLDMRTGWFNLNSPKRTNRQHFCNMLK